MLSQNEVGKGSHIFWELQEVNGGMWTMVDDTPLQHAYFKQSKLILSSLIIFCFCEEKSTAVRWNESSDYFRFLKSVLLNYFEQ